jgi:poly-gamma-glutamate capsule biosynthesis protein CapA/YwtB (metallophosphatase superfamily)
MQRAPRARREVKSSLRRLRDLRVSALYPPVIYTQLYSLRPIFKPACGLLIALALLSLLSTGLEARHAEPSIEVVSVGDILLDRGVARRVERHGKGVVFARVRDSLAGADLAFGNLECPLTLGCDRSPRRIAFRANPRYVEELTFAGFDIVSLANNHSLDCGRTGLLETMRNLKRSGLRWCGAGRTRTEAEAPVVLNVKGIRIAFVGFTAIAPPGVESLKTDGPTVALASRAAIERAVAAARGEADVVVVSLHWGLEYASRPGSEQVELARAAVEAGASLVIGHHTHTLEGMELIARHTGQGTRYALIAYSLGNFAFDSPRAMGKRVTESAILRSQLSREGLVSAEVVPVVLENHLPRPAGREEEQSILARLSTLSAELNTRMAGGRIILP